MSPAVAFIETSIATGSGVLVEGSYVVTNAHVVWPFEKVRVVFSDGTEFPDAPVMGLDLLADLAVIGPVDTSISPLALVDGEAIPIGSEVFLMGYPGEAEGFPQPAIARGIISRLRQWDPIEMTYFQTDAPVAGGHSGVLVSQYGDVIGISGLVFTEALFGLVASAGDVVPRIEGLIAGEDVSRLGTRAIPTEWETLGEQFTLLNDWHIIPFVVSAPAGSLIGVTIDGENDGAFFLVDVFGTLLLDVDDRVTGVETGSAITRLEAPHFLLPFQINEAVGDFRLTADHKVARYQDPDDGVSLSVGQAISAAIDYPLDIDYFVMDLNEGETVTVTVESAMIDPTLSIDFPGALGTHFDSYSGGGPFGTTARAIFRAPHGLPYVVAVLDTFGDGVGGYYLTVEEAPSDSTPDNASPTVASYRDYGDTLLITGPFDIAVNAFTRAIELEPDLPVIYERRATAHSGMGDYASSLADLTTAIELSPMDPQLYESRGRVHWILADHPGALGDLDRAIQLDELLASAHNLRALVNVAQGNYEEALADVNRALALGPGSTGSLDTRGYAHLKAGQYDSARLDYEELSGLGFQDDMYVLLGLGLTYDGLGDIEAADGMVQRGLELAGDIESPDPQLADLIAMGQESLIAGTIELGDSVYVGVLSSYLGGDMIIDHVDEGTPAGNAGLMPGDVILAIGGQEQIPIGYLSDIRDMVLRGELQEALLRVMRGEDLIYFRLIK